MAKLEKFREAHYTNTSKVSDNVRALAISAVGLIWIFKKQDPNGTYEIPEALLLPLLYVIFAMALDFCQYLYGSICWGIYFRQKEKEELSEDKEFYAPPSINLPAYVLFYGKILCISLSYFYLIEFLLISVKLT